MTGVAHNGSVGKLLRIYRAQQAIGDKVDIFFAFGRDKDSFEFYQVFKSFGHFDEQVYFVSNQNDALGRIFDQMAVFFEHFLHFFGGAGRIKNKEDDAGFFYSLQRALYSYIFDNIHGGSQACGVDKTKGNAFDDNGVFDAVAGGAGDVAHDGFFFLQDGVEQRRLAYVGFADDGYRYSVFQHISYLKTF